MSIAEFDYTAIWEQTSPKLADPWIQAKDLRLVFPTIKAEALKQRCANVRSMLGKRPRAPIHAAEVAYVLEIPLPYIVAQVQAARGR